MLQPPVSRARQPGGRAAVVAIRSVTKFYGCPALRVGYAVASSSLAARIAAQLPAWPVTTLALSAAAVAVTEHDYEKASIESNETERSRLGEALKALGFRVFPSATNFLMLQVPSGEPYSTEIWSRLIKEHHIHIRNCDSFDGLQRGLYLRVAVLGPTENDQRARALQIVLER
ncbi:MAG: aminotransferase class I/II-fold pyridoxal phosphate-dependent enzyme [Acidobacteria bacterium]|nr:aminotransferase class I/II-fold pyridoxal phosphate-dependent enzyme [Acidobacteriota bacterium]